MDEFIKAGFPKHGWQHVIAAGCLSVWSLSVILQAQWVSRFCSIFWSARTGCPVNWSGWCKFGHQGEIVLFGSRLLKIFSSLRQILHSQSPVSKWCPNPDVHHLKSTASVSLDAWHLFHRNCFGWWCYDITTRYPKYTIRESQHHWAIPPKFVITPEISAISEETIYFQSVQSPAERVSLPFPGKASVWWYNISDSDSCSAKITVMLFPKTSQCECLSQGQRCFCHAYSSGKNYLSLVENVLWAVKDLANTPHQIPRLRIESNFSH